MDELTREPTIRPIHTSYAFASSLYPSCTVYVTFYLTLDNFLPRSEI